MTCDRPHRLGKEPGCRETFGPDGSFVSDGIGRDQVVIGARVGALAGAIEVLATLTVKDLTAGSGLTFEDAGEHELKGVPDRWHLYRVVGQGA